MKKEKFDLLDEDVVEKLGIKKGDRLVWTIEIINGKEELTDLRVVPDDYRIQENECECILSGDVDKKFNEIDWIFVG